MLLKRKEVHSKADHLRNGQSAIFSIYLSDYSCITISNDETLSAKHRESLFGSQDSLFGDGCW